MISGETILCLSPTPWNDLWRNRQQVMSRLAGQNRVIFVEVYRKFLKPRAKRNECVQPTHGHLEIVEPPRDLPFGARVLPAALVPCLSRIIVNINNLRLTSFLKRYMRAKSISNPILWLYDPLHVDLVGRLGEKLVVYHVHDDTAAYPFNVGIRDVIRQKERLLLVKADLVFDCAKMLYEAHGKLGDHVHYLPNAVDFAHFGKALEASMPVPEDIQTIPRPVIAYYGGVDFRLDVDLLCFIARERPEWSLVLLGRNNLDRYHRNLDLDRFANIHFLGIRGYGVLPNYLKACDVIILPYLVPGYMAIASAPLKLYECFAAGKPLVTVDLPIEPPERELVRIGRSPKEFLAQIEAALADRDEERIRKGIEIAKANSWDDRVQEMSALIETALGNRHDRQ